MFKMIDFSQLEEGDIMFCKIGGFVPGFFPVRVGQWLLAQTSEEERYINHVAMVTSEIGQPVRIVQAMPGGAEEVRLKRETITDNHIFLRPKYDFQMDQAYAAASAAEEYIGTPYSFLDYVAIAGMHMHIENGPIHEYVRSTGHMICSQLVDQALSNAGFHVFDDGRLPQDVMPVELYRALRAMPGTLKLVVK